MKNAVRNAAPHEAITSVWLIALGVFGLTAAIATLDLPEATLFGALLAIQLTLRIRGSVDPVVQWLAVCAIAAAVCTIVVNAFT